MGYEGNLASYRRSVVSLGISRIICKPNVLSRWFHKHTLLHPPSTMTTGAVTFAVGEYSKSEEVKFDRAVPLMEKEFVWPLQEITHGNV